LQTPFLINNGALAAAVAEGDIAERALAGMAAGLLDGAESGLLQGHTLLYVDGDRDAEG
jgi:hypothetical protein